MTWRRISRFEALSVSMPFTKWNEVSMLSGVGFLCVGMFEGDVVRFRRIEPSLQSKADGDKQGADSNIRQR